MKQVLEARIGGGIDIDSILSSILSGDSPASGLCELAQFSELNLRVLMPVDRVHLSTQSNAPGRSRNSRPVVP
jgi:hypothetical protein